MPNIRSSANTILSNHWFWLLFAAAVVTELLMSPVLLQENAQIAEMVILFDLCVFVPAVYAFCYRKHQSVQQILLRVLGLASLGIFISGWIVPEALQTVLPTLFAGRNIALAFVIIVELFAFITILKVAFGKDSNPAEIARKSGVPEFVAKLMLMEANFWKAVWRFFRPKS